MTDKAAVEVPAPVSGRVVSIRGAPGDKIAVGSPLIVFDVGTGAPAATSTAATAAAATPAAGAPAAATPAAVTPAAATQGSASPPAAAHHGAPAGGRIMTS